MNEQGNFSFLQTYDPQLVRLGFARRRIQRLESSLLAKAFRGELIPQNPTDEPARELLKRIKAEREATSTATHCKRKKRAAAG